MKITGLSFFGGIVFTVLIFAFMCCAIGEDFIRHKDRRHPSLYKYVIFIFMGILLTVFSLLFIILTATNILKIMSGIDMSHSPLVSLTGMLFMGEAIFILARYFAYILASEFTKKIVCNRVLPRCAVVCNLLDFLLINEIQYRRYY